jgi:hypothetical protein
MLYIFPHTTNAVFKRLFFRQFLSYSNVSILKLSIRSRQNSNLSRQIVLALSSIFLLLFVFSSQALTPQTTYNVIEGSAPYLTFDGGVTRADDVGALLGITLPGDINITPSSNGSSLSNPIMLQTTNVRFSDIGMIVPPNVSSVSLNTLIGPPNNYWQDDDGDNLILITGDIHLSIVNRYGERIARNHELSVCHAPYKLTLTSTDGRLRTEYGFPQIGHFNASSATYYINPKSEPTLCFAKPNLQYGVNGDPHPYYEFAGPSNIWNPVRGFFVQSTEPSDYGKNFPTTGAHNLYFDLEIGGVNTKQLDWASVTHSGITATMTPNASGTKVRVTLTGPHADARQIYSPLPGNIPRPSLPATFEIIGEDNAGREIIKYGFVLKQWFVNRGRDYKSTYSDSLSWCREIGYQLPRIRDLTNAQCIGVNTGSWCRGIVGASPSSSGNHYKRNINASLFAEWGNPIDYTGAGFISGTEYYWTNDILNYPFIVDPRYGDFVWQFPGVAHNVVCASELRP